MDAQQLALGTAQFGLDYGITNGAGRVSVTEAAAMLEAAWSGGIHTLDTAPAYGVSEASLGRCFFEQPRAWRIVTKVAPVRRPVLQAGDLAAIEAAFRQSLAGLRVRQVDALLVHHAEDLLVPGGEALYGWLREQQAAGRVGRIGASVYEAAVARRLLERYALDVVQLPASLADQRLLQDGTVHRLQDAGVEIHVRSLYLQGLLLAEPGFVAARFPEQGAWVRRLREECRDRGLSPLEACLSFFRSQPAFSVAVVGAAQTAEVCELTAAWQRTRAMDWSAWAVDNPGFIDPRQWKTA